MSNTPWPDEDVAQLLEGASAGRNNKELAVLLNRSTNQIAGKLHRLRFKSQDRAIRHAQHFDRKAGKPSKVKKAKPRPPRTTPQKKKAPHPVIRVARPSDSVWHPKTCQFPIGDPRHSDFHFCGESIIADGRPYCDAHQAICTKPREVKPA